MSFKSCDKCCDNANIRLNAFQSLFSSFFPVFSSFLCVCVKVSEKKIVNIWAPPAFAFDSSAFLLRMNGPFFLLYNVSLLTDYVENVICFRNTKWFLICLYPSTHFVFADASFIKRAKKKTPRINRIHRFITNWIALLIQIYWEKKNQTSTFQCSHTNIYFLFYSFWFSYADYYVPCVRFDEEYGMP